MNVIFIATYQSKIIVSKKDFVTKHKECKPNKEAGVEFCSRFKSFYKSLNSEFKKSYNISTDLTYRRNEKFIEVNLPKEFIEKAKQIAREFEIGTYIPKSETDDEDELWLEPQGLNVHKNSIYGNPFKPYIKVP